MVTEQEIQKLAHEIWEKEGHPNGKDKEHYFRAKQILEGQERDQVIELAPTLPIPQLARQPRIIEIAPANQPQKPTRRKRKQ